MFSKVNGSTWINNFIEIDSDSFTFAEESFKYENLVANKHRYEIIHIYSQLR